MLNFPSYSFLLIIAIVMLVGGLIGSMQCFYKWLVRHYSEDDFKLFFASFGFLLLSLFGGWAFYAGFVSTYKFRNIDISKVSEFEIVESKSQLSPDGEEVKRFQDKQVIKQMLDSLQSCEGFAPNHESFQDGYKIKLILEDGNPNEDFFISVYKRTKNRTKTTLNPHLSSSRSINLGDYNCAEFQNLVRKNIDPLFQGDEGSAK